MTTTSELKNWVMIQRTKFPKIESQIMDIFYLCLSEIDEGGSVRNEIDNAYFEITELIEENK